MPLPEGILFNPDPTAYLPHRFPFLFLDRITSRDPGVSASAVRQVSINEPFSPFLMLEALAQLAGVATVQEEGEGGFLAAIDHAELLAPSTAGETLTFSVRVLKSFGRLFLIEGEVNAADRVLARATLTLGVGKV